MPSCCSWAGYNTSRYPMHSVLTSADVIALDSNPPKYVIWLYETWALSVLVFAERIQINGRSINHSWLRDRFKSAARNKFQQMQYLCNEGSLTHITIVPALVSSSKFRTKHKPKPHLWIDAGTNKNDLPTWSKTLLSQTLQLTSCNNAL